MKIFLKTLLFCCSLAILSACSSTDLSSQRPYIESTVTHNRPVTEPVRSITSFSGSLACMDTLLKENHTPTTFVASKHIEDVSGKAPVWTKGMVITSLSQMSRTSQTFRVVDVEVDPLRQDTVQTLTNLLLPNGQMQIPMPSLYISGAISYLDQSVRSKNRSLGVSNADWEVGMSNDLATTAIGVELHIGDFVTRTLYPGIDSANELVGINKGVGIDGGAKIDKTGVQFTLGGNLSQGTGPAVRTLIELGMVELIGKWAKVPYWQCLALDQTHPEYQRQLLSWFEGMSEGRKIRFFQTGLKSLGYYAGGVNGSMSPQLKHALMLFQVDSQATPSGNLNFESYDRLMKLYVVSDGNGDFKRIGWSSSPKDPIKYTEARQNENINAAQETAGSEVVPVNLAISTNKPNGTYTQGESLQLSITTSRISYPYCFYQDARGSLAQLYPNPFQAARAALANQPVYIPELNNPNTFSIELNTAGAEKIACIAANRDISASLSQITGGNPLEPLTAYAGIEQLMETLQSRMGDEIKGKQTLEWRVVRP